MKLPWDKSYFKLCFYAIFTFIIIYCCKYIIDGAVYALVNASGIYEGIVGTVKYVGSVFSVIIVGFCFAYVLEPFSRNLQRRFSLSPAMAAAIIYLLILCLIVFIAFSIYYEMSCGFRLNFFDGVKRYTQLGKTNINSFAAYIGDALNKCGLSDMAKYLNKINIIHFEMNINTLIGSATTLLLGIAAGFYMLKDKEQIVSSLSRYSSCILPQKINLSLKAFLWELDKIFSEYIRGQLMDALIISAILSVLFCIVKVPFAISVGILSGLFNVIPYFGGVAGFVVSVLAALVGSNVKTAAYTAIIVLAVQQADTLYISPHIIGERVQLSPLMIIIALTAGGKLFGIAGMLAAVPIAALIKRVLEYLCKKQEDVAE